MLSGEEPARKWGGSVLLVDVVRAAIAEIEELDRVDFSVDEALQVSGRAVADATHLLAELIENAVHFSPPGLSVMVRTRPYLPSPGAHVLTIEDWGVGMSPGDLADANDLLRRPREVDLASAQRLGAARGRPAGRPVRHPGVAGVDPRRRRDRRGHAAGGAVHRGRRGQPDAGRRRGSAGAGRSRPSRRTAVRRPGC